MGPSGLVLRPALPGDYPVVADLYNRAFPEEPPITAEWIVGIWKTVDPTRPALQVLAEVDATAVGFGVLSAAPQARAMFILGAVEEAHRGRGVGTRLLQRLAEELDAPRDVRVNVSEGSAPAIAFLRHHGFEERYRVFRSALDLGDFDPDSFARERRASADGGIRFVSLAEQDDEVTRRRIHTLYSELLVDVPRPDPIRPAEFDNWQREWLEMSDSRPDLLVMAVDGDEIVGLSYIKAAPDGTGYNYFSGVARDHRGRGLGTAIKIEALARAQDAHIRRVLTDNDTLNAPILAVNDRLGYERQAGSITFGRVLGPGDIGD